MDRNERQVIDGLFGKLRQVDGQAPQRDAEAEAYIRQQVQAMPAAPYYMAQAILAQEQALGSLQSRVQELERAAAQPAASGGFLGGLFGGGGQPTPPRRGAVPAAQGPIPPQYMQQQPGGMGMAGTGSPWGGGRPAMGGGFLAGAMQTALGVAGGVLIADALTSAFDGGAAEAATMAEDAAGFGEEPPPEPAAEDAAFEDFGGDAGGFDESI
jgi:uncharacterized protein